MNDIDDRVSLTETDADSSTSLPSLPSHSPAVRRRRGNAQSASKAGSDGTESASTDNSSSHSNSNSNSNSNDHNSNSSNGSTNKQPEYSHTLWVHTAVRASPLSKESPEQNYRGFYNLAMLLLFFNNLRLIIENFNKYGFRPSLPGRSVAGSDFMWAFITSMFSLLCLAASLLAELLAVPLPAPVSQSTRSHSRSRPKKDLKPKRITPLATRLIHIVSILAAILVPSHMCWYYIEHPFLSSIPLFIATICSLKLISFAFVNRDLRFQAITGQTPTNFRGKETDESKSLDPSTQTLEFEPTKPPYPDNLTVNNILYFWVAPTLCYQSSYPRTPRFRKSFFIKRVLEFLSAGIAIYFLIEQYAIPTLHNSVSAVRDFQFGEISERVLKLSVISLYIWLLGFYAFFHSFFNALSEVLRFGDRRFYQPWWNAPDIATYWRLWNMPVYNFSKRHIYLPLIVNHKFPAWTATVITFLVSAILHEVLVAIPTKNWGGWGFQGMMGQLPLMVLTRYLLRFRTKIERTIGPKREHTDGVFDTIGNSIFWITFCIVGQPVAIMMCYVEWVNRSERLARSL